MVNKAVSKYMSSLGKKSAQSLTPEQRKERASQAAKKRWKDKAYSVKSPK